MVLSSPLRSTHTPVWFYELLCHSNHQSTFYHLFDPQRRVIYVQKEHCFEFVIEESIRFLFLCDFERKLQE